MKKVGIAVVGFGTVGAGVVEGLLRHHTLIGQRADVDLHLVGIADLDTQSDRGVAIDSSLLTDDAAALIDHPDVQIVVELIGGVTIAKALILRALRAGKSVVTANKALLAECGKEIFSAARENSADLYYEASVGGGIPILKSLREGLVANEIESIYGILNGTCNYILTCMEQEPQPFEDVLAEAQAAGFAEAEPSLDVDGLDTAHKTCILAGLGFGLGIEMSDVVIEGIRDVRPDDLACAQELGYRIKLLAVLKRLGNKSFDIRVSPTLIPADHLLGRVDGVFNAVMVRGDVVGDTLYYGRGAGSLPTASAVLSDVVEVARTIASGVTEKRNPQFDFADGSVQSEVDHEGRYLIRLDLNPDASDGEALEAFLKSRGLGIEKSLIRNPEDQPAAWVGLTGFVRMGALDLALQEGQAKGLFKASLRMIIEDMV